MNYEIGKGTRLGWPLRELSEATGLSIGFLRGEIAAGRLPAKKFGTRVIVPDPAAKAFVDRGSPGRGASHDDEQEAA